MTEDLKLLHARRKSFFLEDLRGRREKTRVDVYMDALKRFAGEKTKIAELNKFHDKFNTLPPSEQKVSVSLFRSPMDMSSFVKEIYKNKSQRQFNRSIEIQHLKKQKIIWTSMKT